MWSWMVGGLARVRSRTIMLVVICVPASRSSGAVTRIGIAIPGGVRVICLISCACTTSSRRKRRGGGYSAGGGGERRGGDGDSGAGGKGGRVGVSGERGKEEAGERGAFLSLVMAGEVGHTFSSVDAFAGGGGG